MDHGLQKDPPLTRDPSCIRGGGGRVTPSSPVRYRPLRHRPPPARGSGGVTATEPHRHPAAHYRSPAAPESFYSRSSLAAPAPKQHEPLTRPVDAAATTGVNPSLATTCTTPGSATTSVSGFPLPPLLPFELGLTRSTAHEEEG
jgi:hypothetical protein